MKNTELLTELCRVAQLIRKPLETDKVVEGSLLLDHLVEKVEAEIRAEANKASGKGAIGKAAQRILNTVHERYADRLSKAYRTDKHVTVCCDTRCVRFNANTAPDLPEYPDTHEYIDVERIVGPASQNTIPVNLPTLSELQAFIKVEKAKMKAEGKRGGVRLILTNGAGGEIHVNASFLVDMLEALPGATCTASRTRTQLSALYFKAENGDGILLPLRPPKEEG